jgi:hypothetical protein
MPTDKQLVSYKQPWEPKTVARKFKMPVTVVKYIMRLIGKNGKPERSRKKIEAYIIEWQKSIN